MVEDLLSDGESDDFGMYTKMGLHVCPNDPNFLQRHGTYVHDVCDINYVEFI